MLKSLKDDREEKNIHLWLDAVLVMIGDSTEDIINTIHVLLMQYQEKIVVNVSDNEFIYDYVDKHYYGCHKIPLNIKKERMLNFDNGLLKKVTINPQNNDEEGFVINE